MRNPKADLPLQITYRQKEYLESELGSKLSSLGLEWSPWDQTWYVPDHQLLSRLQRMLAEQPVKRSKRGRPKNSERPKDPIETMFRGYFEEEEHYDLD